MKWGTLGSLVFLAFLACILASCATQPVPGSGAEPGFFLGLVQGFISVFSLIGSLYWDIRVYAFPNNGTWYDFGFVLGAALFYGGGIQAKFTFSR